MTVVFWVIMPYSFVDGSNSLHVQCILYLLTSIWFYPPSASQPSKMTLYMLFFNQHS